MAAEWREIALGEVAADLTVGYVGPMASEYVPSGIPFLRSQNVEPFRVNHKDLKFISVSFHEKIHKSALSPGDVVIVRTGKPGATAVIPEWLENANCSDLVVVRPGPNLDPVYLMYYLNGAAFHHVAAHLVGAVQQHFNVASARQIMMKLPPLPTQRTIAHVLGSLDDKIELNRHMNRTLEEMARAFFKSWFVDFDPVRAKMEGRKPKGMDAATAALFPDRLVDSELGEVPEGWEVASFTSIVDVLGGGTPKTSVSEYWDGNIPWFSVVDAPKDSDVFVVATEKAITEEGLQNSATRILSEGTTIITARGTVGKIALVGLPMAMNQSCYGLKGKVDPTGYFTYFATRELVSALQQQAHGSVFDTITRDTLDGMSVSVPRPSIVHAYEELISPVMGRIKNNSLESRTLAALRDSLLPKLLSGEVEVEEMGRPA